MKKLSALMLIVGCGAGAIGFYPPFKEAVMPRLPVFLENFLHSTNVSSNNSAAASPKSGTAAVAVIAASAELSPMPLVERTFGIVESPAVAAIDARITSQITEVHVKDGQMVKAGDLLVTLDGLPLQAQLAKDQAIILKDKALEVSLAADLFRAKDLVSKGAGTAQAYDQALSAEKAAEATVSSDQAVIEADRAQLSYTKISAPIGGRLGAVKAVVGNLVGNGGSGSSTSNLVTITQMMPLKVTFQLPERVLPDIRAVFEANQTARVRVFQSGTTIELESGNLDFIDSAVDTSSGTVAMSATIDNKNLNLWPGQYVDVEVTRGELANAVVVPTVAVQQGQSGSYVWLVKNDNTVARSLVTVAHSESNKSAIAAGLATGDRVVVEGQLRLKDGAQVEVSSSPSAQDSAATTPPGVKKTKS
jgi:multidrug efflux system membrane fusion protein